ncbi:MAG: hypothetical protein AVDCRST_MAG16-779, partial [uncultured Frankineae bacterium]
ERRRPQLGHRLRHRRAGLRRAHVRGLGGHQGRALRGRLDGPAARAAPRERAAAGGPSRAARRRPRLPDPAAAPGRGGGADRRVGAGRRLRGALGDLAGRDLRRPGPAGWHHAARPGRGRRRAGHGLRPRGAGQGVRAARRRQGRGVHRRHGPAAGRPGRCAARGGPARRV